MDYDASNEPRLRSSRSIQEFWIDFLLEEEFRVDRGFARSFLAACNSTLNYLRTDQVTHSMSDKHGEADVVVLLSTTREPNRPERLALLIENKITAGFQPRQAERYRLRGEAGKSEDLWDAYLTVLVVPAAYIPTAHGFDAEVPLERIKDWICLNDPTRRAFKLARIDEAISKKNTTGVQIVDPEMTTFRAAYYANLQRFNHRQGTDFSMREPKDTYYGDSWFILKSNALPPRSEIRHMATAGNIELTFKDTDYAKAAGITELLEPDMTLVQTGKYQQHVTVRLPAPKIMTFNAFERDKEIIEAVLASAERLWRMFQRNRSRFETLLTPVSAK